MVADRDIFIVRKQRIVGPELLPDVGRVMNADVKIGVVANEAGHVHPRLGLADKLGLDIVAVALVGEELGQAFAKIHLRLVTTRQPGVEHGLREVFAPLLVEQFGDRDHVEHEVADGDASAAPPVTDGEDAEREVFYGKVAAFGAFDPAFGHGSFAFGKPVQA